MAAVAQNIVNSDDQFTKNCNSPTHKNTNNSETDTKSSDSKSELHKNINELADILSKLNPWAKEFVPSSYREKNDHNIFPVAPNKISANDNFPNNRRRRNNFNQGRRRMNGRAFRAQREESIRRTVYVSDIDQHVTEERLAALFSSCGQIEQRIVMVASQYSGADSLTRVHNNLLSWGLLIVIGGVVNGCLLGFLFKCFGVR